MIAMLEVKDAKGKKHTVELLCAEDESTDVLLERASVSLTAWAETGTTKTAGPFELVKCEVRDAE